MHCTATQLSAGKPSVGNATTSSPFNERDTGSSKARQPCLSFQESSSHS